MDNKKRDNKKKDGGKKKHYTGPFPLNKNFAIETTRKYMKTDPDGPTVDEFSIQDTTDSVDFSEEIPQKKQSKRPRKKRNIINNWFRRHVSELVIGLIIAGVSAFVGIVVYNHSTHLISHDKDIEFLQKDQSNIKSEIHDVNSKVENLKDRVHEIDKKVEIQDVQINNKKR